MKVLVVHNSDEVVDCFTGTEEEILLKLKSSIHWEDIVSRVVNEDAEEGDWEVTNENLITLDKITENLYHDGDSEDGYTLINAK